MHRQFPACLDDQMKRWESIIETSDFDCAAECIKAENSTRSVKYKNYNDVSRRQVGCHSKIPHKKRGTHLQASVPPVYIFQVRLSPALPFLTSVRQCRKVGKSSRLTIFFQWELAKWQSIPRYLPFSSNVLNTKQTERRKGDHQLECNVERLELQHRFARIDEGVFSPSIWEGYKW